MIDGVTFVPARQASMKVRVPGPVRSSSSKTVPEELVTLSLVARDKAPWELAKPKLPAASMPETVPR
jgi:hypothetical protein